MKPITLLITVFLAALALGLSAAPAAAQTPDDDAINRVAQKMNCPTCSGINLADCRTQTCAQWRDQIKDLLAKGYTEDQVLNYFVTQYGPQVLQEPPKSGFTLWLWVLPVTIIILGVAILLYTLRQWQQPAPVSVPAAPASNPDYLSQVEQDLELE